MLVVGYLGPEGTYTELPAQALYADKDVVLRPVASIDHLLCDTAAGKLDACVAPVENSLEGSVNVTLDVMTHDVSLFVQAEIDLPIRHYLLMKPQESGETTVPKTIASHPQALAQCRRTIARLYPDAVVLPVDSTAAAAALAAKRSDVAAVGGERAAGLYGLRVVAADVQDQPYNRTRFWAIGRTPAQQSGACGKTSIVCYTEWDRPGSLCELLQTFSARKINLTRIESRPARTQLGRYLFYFDMAGYASNPVVAEALQEAQRQSSWFKSFGSYPILANGKHFEEER